MPMPSGGLAAATDQPVHAAHPAGEGLVAVATVERHLFAVADVAREVDDGAPDLALPHVHADELPRVARDLQQDGCLATARRSAADLLDQPGRRRAG